MHQQVHTHKHYHHLFRKLFIIHTGGGQPGILEHSFKWIDLMYTGLVADGSQIPPVIFTNDPNVPEDVEGREDAFVVYIPGLTSTPSQDTTHRWLDKIQDYIGDDPHIIHDSGGEFAGAKIQKEFKDFDISTYTIPGAGGAYLNPCDNNFHHDMKAHYFAIRRQTHAEALKAMIDSYFEVPDVHIQNYFQHTKIIAQLPTRDSIKRLISEGYRAGDAHKEEFTNCYNRYLAWKRNLRVSQYNIRENRRNNNIV